MIGSSFVFDDFLVSVSKAEEGHRQFYQTQVFEDSDSFDFVQASLPNDEYFKYQWYLNKIGATEAWKHTQGSSEVVIAVIDTGVQIDHPDLADNIWQNQGEIAGSGRDESSSGFIDDVHGWDFVDNVPDPSPKIEGGFVGAGVSHGTIVAGVAAASGNNDIGVSGVAWEASIMPLRALNEEGKGSAKDVIRAIDYAINNGADIINLSFVGLERSDSMNEALLRAHRAGVIVVAAAGNERGAGEGYNLNETPMYPVCYGSEHQENIVIGVGSTDSLDQKANFSSYGECIDIMAPGYSVFNTVVYAPNKRTQDGDYLNKAYDGFWSGTSMAAPMVSGALALIKASNPELDSNQVKQILLSSADNIDRLNPEYVGQMGSGRLNVGESVKRALDLLNNKNSKVLISSRSSRSGQVKMFDSGTGIVKELEVFPFGFEGGINNIGGDLNGDGEQELIVSAGLGGGPQVRVFSLAGDLKSQFFAYDPDFRGGVNIATGDINGNGKEEIITGAGPGGGPHVRIFDQDGELLGQFFAYDPDFRGGVNITTANVSGDDLHEIVTAPGKGGGPQVRIFDQDLQVLNQFFAYSQSFRGGVNIVAGDINQNGKEEIITGPGSSGEPHIRYFDDQGSIVDSFYAYERDFDNGINLGIINIK